MGNHPTINKKEAERMETKYPNMTVESYGDWFAAVLWTSPREGLIVAQKETEYQAYVDGQAYLQRHGQAGTE